MPAREARRTIHQYEVVEIVLGHAPFLARDGLVSMGTLCRAMPVTGTTSEHPGCPRKTEQEKKRFFNFHHIRPQRYNSIQSASSAIKSPCTTMISVDSRRVNSAFAALRLCGFADGWGPSRPQGRGRAQSRTGYPCSPKETLLQPVAPNASQAEKRRRFWAAHARARWYADYGPHALPGA